MVDELELAGRTTVRHRLLAAHPEQTSLIRASLLRILLELATTPVYTKLHNHFVATNLLYPVSLVSSIEHCTSPLSQSVLVNLKFSQCTTLWIVEATYSSVQETTHHTLQITHQFKILIAVSLGHTVEYCTSPLSQSGACATKKFHCEVRASAGWRQYAMLHPGSDLVRPAV